MTKRSFRHWQKSSKKSISKITKQHIVVIVIVIAPAVPQIVLHLKKENSKPPQLYLLQELRRHGNQNFKRLPSNRKREKGRSNAHTHIEDIQRLVTEVSSTTYKKQRNYLSLTKHWRKQVSLYRLF
jgi:hypothetical protein